MTFMIIDLEILRGPLCNKHAAYLLEIKLLIVIGTQFEI